MRREAYTDAMRRSAAARAMVDAKITEFGSFVYAGDQKAAETARDAAVAALEAHLDLVRVVLEADLAKGY